MKVTQFHPSVTRMACCYCNAPVGVDGSDDTWNEDIRRPAHRLCANRIPTSYAETLCYDPPLSVPKLESIYAAIRGGVKFTDEQKDKILDSIYRTATWDDRDDTFLATSPIRGRAYAVRLIAILGRGLGSVESAGLRCLKGPRRRDPQSRKQGPRAGVRDQDAGGHQRHGGPEAAP